jgi:hypothetical protein
VPQLDLHTHSRIPITSVISVLDGSWLSIRAAARPIVRQIGQAVLTGGAVNSLSCNTAEELLRYAGTATDFWILELAEHFRLYDAGRFPQFNGLQYLNGVLGYASIDQRASGHVTASFAEAICPWVLERVGLAQIEDVYRLRRLQPSDLRLVADFVFYHQDGTLDTCEVKSAWRIRYLSSRALQAGVVQVANAMKTLNLEVGHLMIGIGSPGPGRRYRADMFEFFR